VKESSGRDFVLADQLEQIIRKGLGPRQWEFIRLAQVWQKVVGERAAAHTMPAWIKKDTLWGYVDSTSWMQELAFMKPEILEKVNVHFRSVRLVDIRWLRKPVAKFSPPESREPLPDSIVDPEQEDAFRDLTQVVGESGCREALFNLWQVFQRKMH